MFFIDCITVAYLVYNCVHI